MSEIHEQLISGLTEKLRGIKERKDVFVKAMGLEEKAADARVRVQELVTQIADGQRIIDNLSGKKSEIVGRVCSQIADAMSKLLPYGKAMFKIENDAIFVGWDIPGQGLVPYSGLSGGQEVAFRPALGFVLGGPGSKVVIIEAAEMDDKSLTALLEHLPTETPEDTQIVVSTCHAPSVVPAQWEITILAG